MSVKGICVVASNDFIKSNNYVNKKGEHPKYDSLIYWDKLVLKKEDLNDNNWLYIGEASEEQKDGQLSSMKFHEGWVPIIE